ncbi:recombinase family protein [Streptomyces sp. NEAU-S77]|uniref:recombinase family protein n=1 Tax=Streptomyces sp. NEAU-S77 TaxID=3411033 RepID=UPI003B9DEA60
MATTRRNSRQTSTDVAAIATGSLIPLGAYARLSEDKALRANANPEREEGEQVADQLRRCRAAAARFGGLITKEYSDNDTPASDPFIVREDFERMLVDLESGVIRGILFTHSDRLARLEFDAARVNRIFMMNPSYIGRELDGGVDLSTAEGRAMFMMKATVGGLEVDNTKRRVSGTNRSRAQRGKKGKSHRAFGWNADDKTLHETESKDLLDAIRAIPRGKLVGEVRMEWIEKGYVPRRTKKGNLDLPLTHSTVEARLVNPRNCGYVAYASKAERRESGRLWLPDHVVEVDGKPVLGSWETVCTPEEWRACVGTLEERKKAHQEGLIEPHSTAVKYLLSGWARCGKCTAAVWFNPYDKDKPAYEKYGFRYACLTTQGGCGGVSRVGPPCDDHVRDVYLEHVRRTVGNAVPIEDEQAAADDDQAERDNKRLLEIAGEIDLANERRREKRISVASALDTIEDLEAERAQIKRKQRKEAARQAKEAAKTTGPDLLKEWKSLTISEKRARMKEEIRTVIIHPVGRGKRFDPDFIEVVWRE